MEKLDTRFSTAALGSDQRSKDLIREGKRLATAKIDQPIEYKKRNPTVRTPITTPDEQTFEEFKTQGELSSGEIKAIAKRYRDLGQQMTDSINAEFAPQYTRANERISNETTRAKVLNQRTGNTDSGTGSSAIGKVEKAGEEYLALLDRQKEAKIQLALGKIKNMEYEDIQRQSNEKLATLGEYNTQRKQSLESKKKIAEESLKALASADVDLETLKNDKENESDVETTYDKLLKASGVSPIEFDAKYNSAKNAANKITYTYRNMGNGVVLRTGVKANGTAVPEQEFNYKAPDGYNIIATEDGDLVFKNQKTGEILPKNVVAVGNPPKTTTGKGSPKPAVIQKEENDALNWLARQPNYDPKDKEQFNQDETFRAWAIQKAKEESKNSKKTTESDPLTF